MFCINLLSVLLTSQALNLLLYVASSKMDDRPHVQSVMSACCQISVFCRLINNDMCSSTPSSLNGVAGLHACSSLQNIPDLQITN